ncbi:MAG: RNA-binding domain-containing protein [Candidatus Margulisiibacteriota bacterium]|jgi:ATP-dependent DNA helicase RecG
MTTFEELGRWLRRPEGLNLEFKTASNSFDKKNDLPDYCAALANEGGGKLILGISNNGEIKGTAAFSGTYQKLSHELYTSLKIRIDVEELQHPKGRVLVFHVPSRPKGSRIKSNGHYKFPMRLGESLSEMDDATTKNILNETDPDFSSQFVPGLSFKDLDLSAITRLQSLCATKSKSSNYLKRSPEQFLTDLKLISDKNVTFAALVLLGKSQALDAFLPSSEIIFEWRQVPDKTSFDFRENWRGPFIGLFDVIWEEIDKRNLRTPYKEGFIQNDILSFDRDSIREAILNAVAHRDYTMKGHSIFILASPNAFSIISPGGFMPGITPTNAINKSAWRNQRLAETFEKAGLIERSGQGLDIIFEKTIRDGKGTPNLSRSDSFSVVLDIPAVVKDINFIRFLEHIANEKQIRFSFDELLELERIRENQQVAQVVFKERFIKLGLIDQIGRTRGARYILSHEYYRHEGKIGRHTALAGLPREEKKALILAHLKKHKKGYPKDFSDAFTGLKAKDISNILQELRKTKKIIHVGPKRGGYWQLN